MPYNHVEVKNFVGLYLQRNSFAVPDGALEVAKNCVITFDGVITNRRGFFSFLDPGADTLNNLFNFQDVLMAVYTNKIAWVDSSGVPTVLTGDAVIEAPPRVARSVESNENLYFTSDNGIMKLESFDGRVYSAGVPGALDIRGTLLAVTGPISGNCQVSYRYLFGRRDSHKNLLLSAPSDILVLTNHPVSGASWVRSGGGPYLITVDTLDAHNLSTGMVITVTDPSTGSLSGSQVVTVTSPTQFTITVIVDPGAASGTLDYSAVRSVLLEMSVPEQIDSVEYFWQLYRSTQSADALSSPQPDWKLIREQPLTTEELAENVIYFQDNILDLFAGAELYTNPNSREGEDQANTRPPKCEDVTFYKNFVFYANATSKQTVEISLVTTSPSFINNGDYIELQEDVVTNRYVARTGVGNNTVEAEVVSGGGGTITIGYFAHGLVDGDIVYVSNITGTLPQAEYTVSNAMANTFDITTGITDTATDLWFQGLKDSSGYYIFQLVPPGASPATGIDLTARGIVKAINRDPLAVGYAHYLSGIDDIPGKFLIQARDFNPVPIQVRASSVQTGKAFSPELPDTFGTIVQSDNDVLPNTIYSSKVGEPEAVPLVNTFPIGSRNKKILRIFALRDSVIILKEDGVFRLDGDSTTNFTSTILDGTVVCLSPNSAKLINNQVIFLSNQGVCLVSGTSVQIISRKIEAPIAAVVGNPNLLANTSAVAYESERLYLLTTLAPNTNSASEVYCYNTLTDSWTTWDTYFTQGVIGPENKLFLITLGNIIAKERKNQNKLDYTGESYPATVITVGADNFSAKINTSAVTPEAQDILVLNEVITRIRTVSANGPDWDVTFEYPTNLTPGSAPILYSQFYTQIKMAPFHAGMIDRSKQFAQFQVHTKDPSISVLDISFATDTFGSSELTTWRQSNIGASGGWGNQPWGFFPWGLQNGINLTYATEQALPIRIYVPLFAQRSTFIQAILEHRAAGEQLNIQSLGYQVRGYGERVSR